MTNHPNRNRALKTEINGVRFKLSFDTAGNPHMLKQWLQDRVGHWHWVGAARDHLQHLPRIVG